MQKKMPESMLAVSQPHRKFSQRHSLTCESTSIKLVSKPALQAVKWSTVLLLLLASKYSSWT